MNTPRLAGEEITLGIELDALLYEPAKDLSPLQTNALARRRVASTIVGTGPEGGAARCHHEETCSICEPRQLPSPQPDIHHVYNPHPHRHLGFVRFSMPESRVGTPLRYKDHHAYYFVKYEDLVAHDLPKKDQKDWQGARISTPIILRSELPEKLGQLATSLKVLREHSDARANDSCTLHVHVGCRERLILDWAKPVMTLLTLLEEPLLFPLCAPSRHEKFRDSHLARDSAMARRVQPQCNTLTRFGIEKSTGILSRYCPPSALSFDPSLMSGHLPGHFYDSVRMIWMAKNLEEMMSLCEVNDKALPFFLIRRHLPDIDIPVPGTIVFRYMQMSFDIQLLANWSEVCCSIMKVVTENTAERYQSKITEITSVLKTAYEKKEECWEDLLSVLELGNQIPFWRQQRESYAKGVEPEPPRIPAWRHDRPEFLPTP